MNAFISDSWQAILITTTSMIGHAGADKPPSGRRQNKPAKGPKTGGRERAGSVMQHRHSNVMYKLPHTCVPTIHATQTHMLI